MRISLIGYNSPSLSVVYPVFRQLFPEWVTKLTEINNCKD